MQQQTFAVLVEGVGNFEFRHRTLRDEIRIGVEYSRLTEGVKTPSNWLATFAEVVSTLKVLTVVAPGGWDIDTMDPLDPNSYYRLLRGWRALWEKETSLRKGTAPAAPALSS